MRRGILAKSGVISEPPVEIPISNSLVHYWSFNDSSTRDSITNLDSSSNSDLVLEYNSFFNANVLKNSGTSLRTSTFNISSALINSDAALSFWYYIDGTVEVGGDIISLKGGTTTTYSINGFRWIAFNISSSNSKDDAFLQHYNKGTYNYRPMMAVYWNNNFNTWVNYVITFNRSIPQWTFYRNNVLQTAYRYTGTWINDPFISTIQNSHFGISSQNGKMKNLRIYSRQLTTQDISDIYTNKY